MDVITQIAIASACDDNDLLDSDSTSASDDEMEDIQIIRCSLNSRQCIENYFDVISKYNDVEFRTHFRFDRDGMTFLSDRFSSSSIYQDLLKNPSSRLNVTAYKSMLIFVWFASHKDGYRQIGDRFDLSISSVFEVITRVSLFLSGLAENVIRFPTRQEKTQTAEYFFQKCGFPGIIGCIHGCHIQIDKPSRRDIDYLNRKDCYSIVLQGACNEKRSFIDIFIGYPGSVHDARVFKNSKLYQKINGLAEGNYFLGDSAYPLVMNVLVPYRDNGHLTAIQKNFNKKLSSCRVVIEHTFGILKQRFQQLQHVKLRGHKRIWHFIRACCVLHSLIGDDSSEVVEDCLLNVEVEDEIHNEEAHLEMQNIRDEVANVLIAH